jgi:2-dehydro-3-deoxy-D-arabinonate dehydratase
VALKLYQTTGGPLVETGGQFFAVEGTRWDELIARTDLPEWLTEHTGAGRPFASPCSRVDFLPPIGSQEVWAAGVTYYRSRSARMEESSDAGDCYDKVYSAPRPELFFKAAGHRVVGHGQEVRIRGDSAWNVPEPELTLCLAPDGRMVGYTLGNDMSSRDIEGENPLYLPQAKVYDGSCALGPCLVVSSNPPDDSTEISITILREGKTAFSGSTRLEQMKRTPGELSEYLFREISFPSGCFLMTGTGIVPPSGFTLASGDEIRITMQPVGTLTNTVT